MNFILSLLFVMALLVILPITLLLFAIPFTRNLILRLIRRGFEKQMTRGFESTFNSSDFGFSKTRSQNTNNQWDQNIQHGFHQAFKNGLGGIHFYSTTKFYGVHPDQTSHMRDVTPLKPDEPRLIKESPKELHP